MTSKIKKLSSNVINNIAAGEIIESPYSIVKELIENSIDASSTKVEIYIKGGGLKSIIVKDNGIGIAKDDMKLAFERHTTSKIDNKSDLFDIKTLGFRGEALPSIASVSMVSASSILKTSNNGYKLLIDAGKQINFSKSPIQSGTKIKVENIFYNLPARKKFLKSTKTESLKISNIVKSYSLSYPDIEFTYVIDDKIVLKLPKSNLKSRIINVFGGKISKSIIPVDYSSNEFHMKGFVGNIDLLRKRRANQFIFLNSRLINDRIISKTIRKPFLSSVERSEHPFYVLNIIIPCNSVDVNVHPNKNEVKFRDEKYVLQSIKNGILESIKDEIKIVIPSKSKNKNIFIFNSPISNKLIGVFSILKKETRYKYKLSNFDPIRKSIIGGNKLMRKVAKVSEKILFLCNFFIGVLIDGILEI